MEFFKLCQRLWRALKQDALTQQRLEELKPIIWRTLGWLLGAELIELLVVYPIKMLIDLLSAPSGTQFIWGLSGTQYFALIIVTAGVLYTAASSVTAKMDVSRNSAAWKLYTIINGHGHRKQLSLGLDWHIANSSGKKESLLSKNHKKVDYMIDFFLFDILPLTVRISFIALGMFVINWQLGLLAAGTIALYLLAALFNEKRIDPLRKEYRGFTKRMEISDADLTSGGPDYKTLGRENDCVQPHSDLLEEHWAKETPRHGKFRLFIWQQDQIITISRLLFYWISYASVMNGLLIGTVVMANAWMERIYSNIWRYGAFQYVLNEGLAALRELTELFETASTVVEPTDPQWPDTEQRHDPEICFNDVSFRYPGADENALSNINLSIQTGETIALVGPSGSGKSTLAGLLMRLYDPTEGGIQVCGIDLRDYDSSRYRRDMLGYCAQTLGLFDKTIRDNIAMTKPDATMDEIIAVARQAGALEFIEALADGFDTMIGERGIRLSGGQKQRLVLARALLAKPRILLLDEPTSALDAETQLVVSETIQRLTSARDTTVIIIAHRFSTIAAADRIVVMQTGQIIEIGTHAELEKHNGLYNRLRSLEGVQS